MSNFRIEFLNSPWWLLLLIPAFAFALIPHFRIAKKYRRNRNRICSLVLHLVIMTLTITALSGIYFTYDLPNTSKEVIILVDMSFSGEDSQLEKKQFVKDVITESNSLYSVGVVTFGYDQVYAAPFSTDVEEICSNFDSAELPNSEGTDIASALNYARSLFTNLEGGKILLISDGAQTDGNAQNALKSLVANGVQVSTTYFPNSFTADEVQINDIVLPDYNISLDESFPVTVSVRSKSQVDRNAKISLFDGSATEDEKCIQEQNVIIKEGTQTFDFSCILSQSGMHKLRCVIECDADEIEYNNEFYSYIYIEKFNKVLIIERDMGDAQNLESLLGERDFEATVINIEDTDKMPDTLDKLRDYDEVILMNIANRDMPDGFIEILHTYVNEIGGGLITVGGNVTNEYGSTVANAYDRQDMAGTLYQEMLPVQAIDYTPPLGVMIIIDRSGSMSGAISGSSSKLEEAKRGAIASLYALSERDYCGIMTLDTEFNIEQSIIPATQQSRLIRTINDINIGGGTQYTGAIRRAGEALIGLRNKVEKRHIILISDGEPGDKLEEYGAAIEANYNAGITFSVVTIGVLNNSQAEKDMNEAAEIGHGKSYKVNDGSLSDKMRDDLKRDEITSINPEPFKPQVRDHTAVVKGIDETQIPNLGGYYGTKIRDDESVSVPLSGEFVPIYAQWRYGMGKVGSFMCDLTGRGWSSEFMGNQVGQQLIVNMVNSVLPTSNIRATGITAEFTEDNFSTHVSVYADVAEGERIELTVSTIPKEGETADIIQKIAPSDAEGYSRMTFNIKTPGVYQVTVSKLDSDNNILSSVNKFRTFSYSKEYDRFVEESVCKELMIELANSGRGKIISTDSPWLIYDDMAESLHNQFDPRWIFIIIALVLFLLDIAVRKFKFKWIHEIVRDRRAIKNDVESEYRG